MRRPPRLQPGLERSLSSAAPSSGDSRLSVVLIATRPRSRLFRELRSLDPNLVVGDNEPYSGKHIHDFTVDHHAEAEGLPHVSIEMRQDLIATEEGTEHWAEILTSALQPILSDENLYTHWTQ